MKKKVLGKKLFAVLLVLAMLVGGLTACSAGNKYSDTVDGGRIIYNDAGKVFWADRDVTSIEIPEQLPNKHGQMVSITGFNANAFNGCTKLESITIPATVTAIGEKVFHRCPALTEINFEGSEADWAAITESMTEENAYNGNELLFSEDVTINFGK